MSDHDHFEKDQNASGPFPNGLDQGTGHEEAQGERDTVKRAQTLLHGAHDMLNTLLAKQAEHATLDDEIASARAAQTVHAIEHGDGPIPTDEPSGFAARKVARDHCEAELANVREAIPLLQAQLSDAKRHADQAAFEIDAAVEAVFVKEAEELTNHYVE